MVLLERALTTPSLLDGSGFFKPFEPIRTLYLKLKFPHGPELSSESIMSPTFGESILALSTDDATRPPRGSIFKLTKQADVTIRHGNDTPLLKNLHDASCGL